MGKGDPSGLLGQAYFPWVSTPSCPWQPGTWDRMEPQVGTQFDTPLLSSRSFSAPKCGRGKPALVRRHTLEDRSELISCIENGNYAKAARIAAGKSAWKGERQGLVLVAWGCESSPPSLHLRKGVNSCLTHRWRIRPVLGCIVLGSD